MKAKAFKVMKAAHPDYDELIANRKAIKAAKVLAAQVLADEVIAAKLQNDLDLEKEKLIGCFIEYHAVKLSLRVASKNLDQNIMVPKLCLLNEVKAFACFRLSHKKEFPIGFTYKGKQIVDDDRFVILDYII